MPCQVWQGDAWRSQFFPTWEAPNFKILAEQSLEQELNLVPRPNLPPLKKSLENTFSRSVPPATLAGELRTYITSEEPSTPRAQPSITYSRSSAARIILTANKTTKQKGLQSPKLLLEIMNAVVHCWLERKMTLKNAPSVLKKVCLRPEALPEKTASEHCLP